MKLFRKQVEQIELLDDLMIENKQCYRQAEIYSNILASLMDARASIVSNNINVLMKTLNIIIIIAILSWAGIARVIRSVTMSIKERAFVDAAIIAGASDSRLIFRHIAPNVLPYAFLYMTFNISGAIVTEAVLAFLGFGDGNYVTWGMMLQYLQISGHALDAPWWLLPPGVAITLLSLAFYLIGRAFDEVVNPRLRKR